MMTGCENDSYFLQGENKCPSAEENGVSILHGNALAFVKVLQGIPHKNHYNNFPVVMKISDPL